MSNDVVHIAVAGGDALVREGLRSIVEDARYRVEVVAASIGEVFAYPDRLDLIVFLRFSDSDLQLLDAVAKLHERWPDARMVAIADGSVHQLIAALRAGFDGYLEPDISAEALLRFLSLIVLGQRVISTASLDLGKEFENGTTYDAAVYENQAHRIDPGLLTSRERELLAFLMEGQSNKVIARRLGLAEATVKAQMARLFGKIGAANRTQAAVLAWAAHGAPPLEAT